MKKTILSLAIVILATGCSTAPMRDKEKEYVMTSATDVGSTTAVLSSGVGLESNPVTFPGVVLAKVAIYAYAKNLPDAEKDSLLHTSSSAFSGATVNNLLVLAGATTGVSVLAGLVTGVYYYFKDDKKESVPVENTMPVVASLGE